MVSRKYVSLEEISLPYPLGGAMHPYEEGIVNLTRALIGLGLRTFSSCEGHITNRESYPFVSFPSRDKVPEELLRALEDFNKSNFPTWNLSKGERLVYVQPDEKADDMDELVRIRYSSEDLAQFIFDGYLKTIKFL